MTLSFSYTFEVGNSPLTTRQNAQSASRAQVGGTDRPLCALIMKDVMEQVLSYVSKREGCCELQTGLYPPNDLLSARKRIVPRGFRDQNAGQDRRLKKKKGHQFFCPEAHLSTSLFSRSGA